MAEFVLATLPDPAIVVCMTMSFQLPEQPTYLGDDVIAEVNTSPGFGKYFTDHMALADWDAEAGWYNDRLVPYATIGFDPADAVFHYGQEIFEGLKAYRHADGSIWLFRPRNNAVRFMNSARRMDLPELPEEDFMNSVTNLVKLDARWVPGGDEQSLYLRPFMIANESFLGVRSAKKVLYCCIASPVGAYFESGVQPVDIWIARDQSRVAAGGTGAAKCGGNYAASLMTQEVAYQKGCSQVLFTDAATHTFIEELGGMNFFMVTKSGQLVTPDLNGNVLPGVTRDSLLALAPTLDLTPVERPIPLAEVLDGLASGDVTEVFACGTAAVITPIGSLHDEDGRHDTPGDHKVTLALRQRLCDIQWGRAPDPFGWMQKVVDADKTQVS